MVPRISYIRRQTCCAIWLAALLLLASGVPAGASKPNEPAITIPLGPLGFAGVPVRFALGRATMYTVHFVDPTHVLLTFNARTLLTRLPDAREDDDDRNVAALLLELPSGRVVARTEWRTRDRQQYLWALGRGRFLLRQRTRLSVIEPMRRLAEGEAFHQQLFLDLHRTIGFISVSPGGDLLTVETVPRERTKGQAAVVLSNDDTLDEGNEVLDRRVPVQIHFYRLHEDKASLAPAGSEPGTEFHAQSSGVIYSPSLVNVPATAEGYLDIVKESDTVFDFDFKTHTGKKTELAAYDTTCSPKPYFISRSEFLAFGCRGSVDKGEVSVFNLRGEEPWVQTYSEQYLAPTVVSAPAAGRYAISRLTLNRASMVDPDNLTPDNVTAQEVVVQQTHDGRSLLKVQATPYQRAGQNYDLSTDGLMFATVQDGNLQIYRLPELTGKDRSEVARAMSVVPEKNDAMIALDSSPVTRANDARADGVKVGAEVMQKSAGEVVPLPTPADEGKTNPEDGNVVGDVPAARRQAPSLYDPEHPKPPK